jgi:hypothetical protein
MKKSAKVIALCMALLLCAAVGAFAKQNVEKHTVHIGLNPFSWIFGVWNAEVGAPITGLVEVAGQVNYINGREVANIFGGDVTVYPINLTLGGIVRLFPTLNATGFWVGARFMYLNYTWVDGATETTYNDMTAGVELGYRYLWDFPGGWGMFIQGYFGIERYFFHGEIADLTGIPILLVGGMQLGFHM